MAAIDPETAVWDAIQQSIMPILHMEKEWNQEKLHKAIYGYFTKGTKTISTVSRKPWTEQVQEYADKVYGSIWNGLGDRDWVEHVDFTYCLDMAVKVYFPPATLSVVTPEEVSQQTYLSSESSWDCWRYYTYRWDVIQRCVPGKMGPKKVRDAVDTAREEVLKTLPATLDEFVQGWVTGSIKKLAESSQGNPTGTLQLSGASSLFGGLLKSGGGAPRWLLQQAGGSLESADLQTALQLAYSSYADEGYGPMSGAGGMGGGKGMGKASGKPAQALFSPYQVVQGNMAGGMGW